MFTQPCFIRKSTGELRDWLTLIGYQYGGKDTDRGEKGIYCNQDEFFEVYRYTKPTRDFKIIDCGDDMDLFQSVAALRDDSDYMQWFVCEEDIIIIDDILHKKCDFVLHEKLERVIQSNLYHKATVSELIEHFK